MGRDLAVKNCPLRLLAKAADHIPQKQQTIEDLDDRVREYLSDSFCKPSVLRQQIFFQLSPFLLKLLGGYCHHSRGCGVNCLVADLLSTAYIEFDDLIDEFDFDRNLNFTGYIVRGLAWRIFNVFVKEKHYWEHHILVGSQAKDMAFNDWEIENRWLSVIEVQELLSVLRPSRRHLVLLHDLLGYTCSDLAAIQKTTTETVQKRIQRARKKMLAFYQSKNRGENCVVALQKNL